MGHLKKKWMDSQIMRQKLKNENSNDNIFKTFLIILSNPSKYSPSHTTSFVSKVQIFWILSGTDLILRKIPNKVKCILDNLTSYFILSNIQTEQKSFNTLNLSSVQIVTITVGSCSFLEYSPIFWKFWASILEMSILQEKLLISRNLTQIFLG